MSIQDKRSRNSPVLKALKGFFLFFPLSMGVEASQHGSVPGDNHRTTEGQKASSLKQKDWPAFEIPVNREKSSRLSGLKAITAEAQPEAARGVKETGAIQVRDEGILVKKPSVTHDVSWKMNVMIGQFWSDVKIHEKNAGTELYPNRDGKLSRRLTHTPIDVYHDPQSLALVSSDTR